MEFDHFELEDIEQLYKDAQADMRSISEIVSPRWLKEYAFPNFEDDVYRGSFCVDNVPRDFDWAEKRIQQRWSNIWQRAMLEIFESRKENRKMFTGSVELRSRTLVDRYLSIDSDCEDNSQLLQLIRPIYSKVESELIAKYKVYRRWTTANLKYLAEEVANCNIEISRDELRTKKDFDAFCNKLMTWDGGYYFENAYDRFTDLIPIAELSPDQLYAVHKHYVEYKAGVAETAE